MKLQRVKENDSYTQQTAVFSVQEHFNPLTKLLRVQGEFERFVLEQGHERTLIFRMASTCTESLSSIRSMVSSIRMWCRCFSMNFFSSSIRSCFCVRMGWVRTENSGQVSLKMWLFLDNNMKKRPVYKKTICWSSSRLFVLFLKCPCVTERVASWASNSKRGYLFSLDIN